MGLTLRWFPNCTSCGYWNVLHVYVCPKKHKLVLIVTESYDLPFQGLYAYF